MPLSELEFVVLCLGVAAAYWARAYEARQYRYEVKLQQQRGGQRG